MPYETPDLKATDRLLGLLSRRQSPLVLAYHGIGDDPEGRLDVSLSCFRDHVKLLQDIGWATPTADELLGAGRAPQPSCVITFDDCYVGTLGAAELLEGARMRATWFAVSSALTGRVTWQQERAERLKTLTGAELRSLQKAGMEIGSHSVSHRRMPTLDATQLRYEAYYSRAALMQELGREVRTFAYPFGNFDEACKSAVRDAGYAAAFATIGGTARLADDTFSIPRIIMLAQDDWRRFLWKLAFAAKTFNLRNVSRGLRGIVAPARLPLPARA